MELPADGLAMLRERFHEAEEICRALRAGEVDAVIVGPTDDDKRVLLLSGSYARYRQLVEDMAQGAVTLTGSGEILFANQSFAHLIQRPLRELFRTPFVAHVTDAHAGRLKALLGGARDIEVDLRTAAGEPLPVRLSLVSASDDFATLLVTDLRTQRLMEEAAATLEAIRRGEVDGFVLGGERVALLDSSLGAYRSMVERMRQGAVILGRDTEITYANERFVLMARVPHGHVLGQPLERFVEGGAQALQPLLAAREAGQAELRLRQSNGETLAVQATVTRMDGQRLLLFSDITEKKRHEASDERTRKFLGMLAHEFRNMLSPIAASVHFLKQSQPLDADGVKALDMIERQSGRLLALVDDLRRINPKE